MSTHTHTHTHPNRIEEGGNPYHHPPCIITGPYHPLGLLPLSRACNPYARTYARPDTKYQVWEEFGHKHVVDTPITAHAFTVVGYVYVYVLRVCSEIVIEPDNIKHAYCMYVVIARPDRPGVIVAAAVGGSVVGGLAAGWLWTAQSGYFTSAVEAYTNARLLALDQRRESGETGGEEGDAERGDEADTEADRRAVKQKAASSFAGTFSTAYLGFEVKKRKYNQNKLWGAENILAVILDGVLWATRAQT
eukprot:1182605-Prorocentrum_minimum.AAC.6